MKKKVFYTVVIFFAMLELKAQTNDLVINKYIRLPKDSIESSLLIENLNRFLILSQQKNEDNYLVSNKGKKETYLLLDEFKGIDRHPNDSACFKPYLTNISPLDKNQYWVQLSYINTENNISLLRASFELVATKENDRFVFSSPLLRNTRTWKLMICGSCIFHYQTDIDKEQAESYANQVMKFDKMLESSIKKTELYLCDNSIDLLQLIGVNYKMDYNGQSYNETAGVSDDEIIIVQGIDNSTLKEFDPHDLFHERASAAIPTGVNHFMVCGCAYLYGGSWGMSWEEIQKTFKARMTYNKKTDWLTLYLDSYNFGESKAKHLLIPQFINALIIRKVVEEQGFSPVIKLLSSESMLKDRGRFFSVLDKVTGINEKNFNKKASELIDEAMKQI